MLKPLLEKTMWAVFAPDGYIQVRTISYVLKDAKDLAIAYWERGDKTWKDYAAAGFTVSKISVNIKPIIMATKKKAAKKSSEDILRAATKKLIKELYSYWRKNAAIYRKSSLPEATPFHKSLDVVTKLLEEKFVYRSADTGKIVTEKFAKANPKTTFKDTIKK